MRPPLRGCGKGIVDSQLKEVCDDGNAVVGDGCSYECRSDETCGNGYVDPIEIVDSVPVQAEF